MTKKTLNVTKKTRITILTKLKLFYPKYFFVLFLLALNFLLYVYVTVRTVLLNKGENIMRLEGKIGLVTAAGSGMGRAGAIRFAQEGALVGVVDVDEDAVASVVNEIEENGGKAKGIVADLTKDADSKRIVTETAKYFNGLDFVWNHVGYPGPAAVEGVEMDDFDLTLDLNLKTILITTDAALTELRARGGGSLLFTASTSGLAGSGFSPIYSMAKFGVVGFVRALAKRVAKDNIRANAICPGPIDTPMLRVFVARPDQQSTVGMDKEDLVKKRGGVGPMGRPGRPDEVANAALFLLSDEASFVNGIAMPVDGGITA